MSVRAKCFCENERVEPVVLACRRLMAFSRPSGHTWTHREHPETGGMKPVDDDPVGSLDGDTDKLRQSGKSLDESVQAVDRVSVALVEHLDAGVVDRSDLVMGGTPIDASERGHERLLR